MAAGVYITAVSNRGHERVSELGFSYNYTSSSLPAPLSLSSIVLHLFSCSIALDVRLARSNSPTQCSSNYPPALSSVCAQRRADNPGQDNRNRPPFVFASMGLVTVTVNSGHRLRPGWASRTEGPLTGRTKAEKQNKQCLNLLSKTPT